MKRVIILIMLLSISLAWSQAEWDTDGIPIRQGVNIEWFRSAVALEDGGCIYTWSDTRRGDRDAFAARVDSDGNLVWGSEAIMVNGEINRQEDIVVINGTGDETIYAWVEFRHEDAGDIYAQKLDGDGNLMWDPAGVPLCLVEDIQISLNIVSDDNGGAYIIWLDDRNPGGSDIYGTHILSDGTIAEGWDVDGSPIIQMEGGQTQHTFWEDGEGGAICVWYDQRNPDNHNLYMQRVASDGTLMWGEEGAVLCDAEGIQEKAKISPDGTGNFIVSWRDKRNNLNGDIYANRIDLDGNVLWAEDLVIYEGMNIQRNPRVTTASDTGVFVTWEDGRNSYDFKDIFVQKVTVDGTLGWDTEGVIVSDAINDQLNPRLVGDDDGGVWITWDDGRDGNHPNEDIYLQHFDSDGVQQLGDNGMVLCDASGFQFSPLIKKDGNGQIYLSWGDDRTGSTGLYFQMIDDSGNELLDDNGVLVYYGLCGDALEFMMAGTGEKEVLFWQDTRFSSVAMQIYMQVLNSDGSFDLVEDGVAITPMTGFDQDKFDIDLVDDEVAVTWQELRDLKMKTYVQKVDIEGNNYWGEDNMGLRLSSRDSEQEGPHVSNEDGAYYIGWSDRFGFMSDIVNQVCAQKVVDGEIQWDAEGVPVGDYDYDDVLTDVVGRYFIWQNEEFQNYNIFANYLNEDGTAAAGWGDNGILICDAPANQQNAQGMITDAGLLIVWQDQRDSVDADIYGQMVTESGDILWEANGKPLVINVEDQVNPVMKYYDEHVYMIWEDLRNGDDFDIYMQKFDLDGNEVWTEGGVEIAVKPNEQANPDFTVNDTEIVIFWDDVDAGENKDIYLKKLDLDGNTIDGGDSGINICDAIKNQSNPTAVLDNSDNTIVIWSDFRSSGKTDIYNIYAQCIAPGLALDDFDVDEQVMINMSNYPNPFKKGTILSFALGNQQLIDAKVEIYNVRGQKVRSLEMEDNRVYWDGCDSFGKLTATGVYMYRVDSKYYSSQPAKMIRVK